MKYTVGEVRARFEAWLIREHEYAPEDLIWQEKRNCYADYATHLAWSAYRDAYAYAARIEADESTMPAATSCADQAKGETGYCTFHTNVPWGTKLFTRPPAQVEPTEAVISKAVEVFLDAAPEWNDYLVKDGMRSALLAVWPNPPAQAAQVDAFADRLRQSIMRDTFQPTADPVAQGEASPGRCKACGRATRAVCDGLDGNGLGCTNAPSIDLAAVREVIAHLRSFRSNTPPTWVHLDDAADKLEAALPELKP